MLHLNRPRLPGSPPQLWWFYFWYIVLKPTQMQVLLYVFVKSFFTYLYLLWTQSFLYPSLALLQNRPEQAFPNGYIPVGCINHETFKSATYFEKDKQRQHKQIIHQKAHVTNTVSTAKIFPFLSEKRLILGVRSAPAKPIC